MTGHFAAIHASYPPDAWSAHIRSLEETPDHFLQLCVLFLKVDDQVRRISRMDP